MKGKNAAYQEKIDHLRFFAALLIIIYHMVWKYQRSCVALGLAATTVAPPFFNLFLEGHTAVSLFMTLSGFLFAIICKGKEIDNWSFYRNRFLRIYPLFIAVLLVACYIDPVRNNLTSLATSLFLLQNTPSAVYLDDCTSSLWAIAVEFQFYLLFPFLLTFSRKYGLRYLIGLMGLMCFVRLAVFLITGQVREFAYMTIFGRLDQFLIGMILGFSFDKLKTKLQHPAALVGSVLGVFALTFLFNKYGWAFGDGISRVFLVDLEALVWGFLIVSYNASAFKFPNPAARFLAYGGTLSFSLYVIHPFLMRLAPWFAQFIYHPHSRFPLLAHLAAHLSHQPWWTGLIFGLGIAIPVTFFVSMLTYPLIEKPFLELRTTYARPSKEKLEELLEPSKVLVS